MGFFTRLKTGWALSMDSLDVLRAEPSLTAFPAVAAVASAVYLVLVLGGVAVLFTLVGLMLAFVVLVALGGSPAGIVAAVVLAVLVVVAAYLVGSALSAVAKTALYVYATEGERPQQFENVDFQQAARGN